MTATGRGQAARSDSRNGGWDPGPLVDVIVEQDRQDREQWAARDNRVERACRTGQICGDCGDQLADGDNVVRVTFQRYARSLFGGSPWHTWRAGPVCLDCWNRHVEDDHGHYRLTGGADEADWQVEGCHGCGRPVHQLAGRRRRVVACSERCRSRAWRAIRTRRRQLQRDPLACDRCGESLRGTRSDARYCSNACRQAAYRARKADDGARA